MFRLSVWKLILWLFCNTSVGGGGGGDFIGMALLFQHMFSGRDLVSLFWISQKIICLDVLVKLSVWHVCLGTLTYSLVALLAS